MSPAVAKAQRYTQDSPCPICEGWESLPRGKGQRCVGYLSSNGKYAYCTREEHAGALQLDQRPNPPAYRHKLEGKCRCDQKVHGVEPLNTITAPELMKRYGDDGNGRTRTSGKIVATYDYLNAAGDLVHQTVRYEPKNFRQRRPDSNGEWIWNMKGITPILYNLPALLETDPSETVWIPEGEKHVDRLCELGLVATCNPMGAGKWKPEYSEHLKGRDVLILADHDSEGESHAESVAASLHGKALQIRILGFPELPKGGDVLDWLAADTGRGRRELLSLAETRARAWRPDSARDDRLDEILKSRPVAFIDLDAEPPPIDWLVPGWLARKDVALFGGAGGIGKSTTAGDLAQRLARGESWCGIEAGEPCKVLYVDEEMGKDETHRLFSRLGGSHPKLKVASDQGIRLDSEDDCIRLEALIKYYAPDVIILDSVQQVFGDTDENSAVAIGAVYARLFRLRDLYGVTFVLVHHKKKSPHGVKVDALELVRGSTAHGTQSSTVWFAVSGGQDVMDIRQVKRRGSRKRGITLRYSEDCEGGAITLTGEPLIDQETEIERAGEWIVDLAADKGVLKTAEAKAAGKSEGFGESTVERALAHALKMGALVRPRRGCYAIPRSDDGAENGDVLPF